MRVCIPVLLFILLLGTGLASSAWALDIPSDPKEALELARLEKKKGVKELNLARQGGPGESKHSRTAMKHLENAQELYSAYFEKVGEDPKIEEEMSELQSLLYWCRKMTPLREEESEPEPPPPPDPAKEKPKAAPPRNPLEAPRPGEPVPKPAPPRDRNEVAKELFEDAERFAKQFPDLRLQIVAAYFRVADAYRDTPWGMKALEKAIEYARGWTGPKATPDKPTPEVKAPASKPEEKKPPEPMITDPMLLRLRLRHADAAVRTASINGLVKVAGADAVPDLHELFHKELDPKVRETVRARLAELKDKRTYKAFRKFWATHDPIVAEDFIRLVGAMGTHKDVRFMVYAAVYNVERLTPPTTQAIIDDDGDPLDEYISTIRSAYGTGLRKVLLDSVKVMGKTGSKGLTNLFKKHGAGAREAILTLGMVGDVKSGKYVVGYLVQYKAGIYRNEALASLKMMGDDVIPYLIQALGRPQLKMWAAWLLRDMTGQGFGGGSPGKWWAWWRANKRR
ncbi:MAG: HEAT repeat domain-containing protein [Planctomycetota bacterium]|jgi:hypothetical protein